MQAFNPKDIYPCTVDRSTYTYDVSMEMLFGDLCSANVFQADKELHAQLGIKGPEADDEESQRSTPSPGRDRPVISQPRHSEPTLRHTQPEETNHSISSEASPIRSSSTVRCETPKKRVKTSGTRHSSTPSSTQSESNVRREAMYNAALHQRWEKGFFTSVDGYHNQEPEKEL